MLGVSDDFIKGHVELYGTGMQVKELVSRLYWECKAAGYNVATCNERYLLVFEHGMEKTFAFRKDNKAGHYTAKVVCVEKIRHT